MQANWKNTSHLTAVGRHMARIHDWAQKAKEGQERLKLCPARLQLGLLGRVEGEVGWTPAPVPS